MNWKGVINVSKKKRRYGKKHHKRRAVDLHTTDWHHCLFMRRNWEKGWAKRLREHRYCGSQIPKNTLHRQIHEAVRNVPTPDDWYCAQIYEAIESWIEGGFIHIDDPIDKKLEMLIKCFQVKYPATAEALRKELEVVHQFQDRQ